MLKSDLVRTEGWLLFSAAIPNPSTGDRAALFTEIGDLPGGCKIACDSANALQLRAELPESSESAERVAAIEAGFATGAARLGLGVPPELAALASCPSEPIDLANLCREAGWPFEERADGSLVVDLGVSGAYLPALIEVRSDCVGIGADLVELPENNDPCRAALVAFLLRVNGAFRMARAVIARAEARARLEIELPRATSSAELGDAIAAIAIAARHCALEARLLAANESIARAFLERNGMSPSL